MRVIVCYDVPSNARRNRLFKRLKAFLEPVQKSVFEGVLPARLRPALMECITGIVDREVDTVRVYQVCKGCAALMDLIGTSQVVADREEDTVI